MSDPSRTYPDNAPIFARKEEGRLKRAALSFAEKLIALDALRARAQPIVDAREERKRIEQGLSSSDH